MFSESAPGKYVLRPFPNSTTDAVPAYFPEKDIAAIVRGGRQMRKARISDRAETTMITTVRNRIDACY